MKIEPTGYRWRSKKNGTMSQPASKKMHGIKAANGLLTQPEISLIY
jgi:hypothetical protein